MSAAPTREPLTALDGIAVALVVASAGALLWLGVFGAQMQAMYADFGADLELPLLTRFTTSVWGPPLCALPVLAVLGVGLGARPIARRRAGIVLAFVLVLVAAVYAGDYLPLWQVAGAIRAD